VILASNQTPNLNLHSWEPTDYAKREEFNDNFDTIDSTVGLLQKVTSKFDTTATHQIFVNGTSGSDSNDGTTAAKAYKSIDKALGQLRATSETAIDGSWEIVLNGSFANGYKVNNLPRFRYPLKITGQINSDGTPATVFDGTNANSKIGLWIEPCPDLRIEVRNIYFKNYKNSFNGYGLLMKSGGYLIVENCRADNCDTGFAAIRNVSFSFGKKTKATNCSIGFRAQYGAMGTFGEPTLADGLVITNCIQGVDVTRGSVVHVDYCTISGSNYGGITIDQNSRAHVKGNRIDNCDHGVRTEGGAEWLNNTEEPNVFTNCKVNYAHYGNSRESRLYSQSANNEFRIGVSTDKYTLTGTTTNTPVYFGSALGRLPDNFFLMKAQRLRFVVHGTITGAGNKTFSIRSTDPNGNDNVTFNGYTENGAGAFQLECFVYPIDKTKVRAVLKSSTHFYSPRMYTKESSIDLTRERLFRMYCQLSDPTATVEFTSFETFLMG
jgi:Right handed beta helix region